jgi:hypothetical protein
VGAITWTGGCRSYFSFPCWHWSKVPAAADSCKNIRLSADAANPLNRSRNWRADGDGWRFARAIDGLHGWKRALARIVERSRPETVASVQQCWRGIAEIATAAVWARLHLATGRSNCEVCSNPRGPPPFLSADTGSVIKIGALHISQLRVPFDGARRRSVQVGGRVAALQAWSAREIECRRWLRLQRSRRSPHHLPLIS